MVNREGKRYITSAPIGSREVKLKIDSQTNRPTAIRVYRKVSLLIKLDKISCDQIHKLYLSNEKCINII